MAELEIPFDLKQLSLYRRGDKTGVYYPVRWPLKQGRGRWGEFPLVVVREHYRKLGYTVLASEPRLAEGQGFILLSYPGYRKRRHRALGGQCKTGHAGSLQNRPYEMARDVILFNPLSPDPASLFWFSNSAAHI